MHNQAISVLETNQRICHFLVPPQTNVALKNILELLIIEFKSINNPNIVPYNYESTKMLIQLYLGMLFISILYYLYNSSNYKLSTSNSAHGEHD